MGVRLFPRRYCIPPVGYVFPDITGKGAPFGVDGDDALSQAPHAKVAFNSLTTNAHNFGCSHTGHKPRKVK